MYATLQVALMVHVCDIITGSINVTLQAVLMVHVCDIAGSINGTCM